MSEGYDDESKRLDRKNDPTRPNQRLELQKQLQAKESRRRELGKLQSALQRKQLMEQQKKDKKEQGKKGIVTADQKETAEQKIDNEKRHADADKAQGPEKPTQSV